MKAAAPQLRGAAVETIGDLTEQLLGDLALGFVARLGRRAPHVGEERWRLLGAGRRAKSRCRSVPDQE